MNDIVGFLMEHGAIVVFIAVLAEQIGLPVPAVPFLVTAGALSASGHLDLAVAAGAAVLASVVGDQVWFELGRRRGRQVLGWLCKISFEPLACIRRTEDFFSRHGANSLIVAKFIPGLSTIAPPLAGIVGLRLPQYLLYNGVGTILWVGSGIGLGMAFSDQLEQGLLMAANLGPTVALTFLGIVIGYAVYKTIHRYRIERLVPRLTVRQLTEKIATGEDPVIIDLRPHGARQNVPAIPGALPLSLDDVLARQHELPHDRDIVLYCACPQDATSVQAAWKLRAQGFTHVWPLAGGIEAWHAMDREAGQDVKLAHIHTAPA